MKDPVLIKSNRYGMTLRFDPELPFDLLRERVHEKLHAFTHFFNHACMVVTFEGRTFTKEEEQAMAETIVGDIETGATVICKGSVTVTGTIYGTVIAGATGDYNAMIAAIDMKPELLRIGEIEVKPVIGGSYSWARLL